MNTIQEHANMVEALVKPGADIIAEMTPAKANNIHMAIGITGEAGELLDAVKKECMYNKVIDVENVIEELGDLEFYMEGLRQSLAITRQETLQHNLDKLATRYKGKQFSNKAASDRADKV